MVRVLAANPAEHDARDPAQSRREFNSPIDCLVHAPIQTHAANQCNPKLCNYRLTMPRRVRHAQRVTGQEESFRVWVYEFGVGRLASTLGVHRNSVTKWCNGAEPARKHWPKLHRLSGGRYFMSAEQLSQLRGVCKG